MDDAVKLPCPSCGTVNRAAAQRVAQAVCGNCGQRLAPDAPVEVRASVFDRVVGNSQLPVVVDFWAPWCAPCRMMEPAFAAVAGELVGRAVFLKVDTEDQPELGGRFGIRSIPTTAVFKGGREVARQPGAMDAVALRQWLQPVLG